ncbi:MAG: protein phosphatase 2C domain-containing protein [Lachnospiraceae bacterium]|nr:protein phosphatase 2C domain-containing protein [Lachnospiraceae bacterium]
MFGSKRRDDNKRFFPNQTSSVSGAPVIRKVPALTTLVRTATGNRQYQQDAVYVSESKILASNKKTRILAVVCDGMGGMADGGRASQTAIQMMVGGFQKVEKNPELDIPTFFRQGIYAIDRTIYEFPKADGRGSGTTMVACIAEDHKLYWASVGDSRIYIIRGKQMQQVTRDHNYWLRLQEMIKEGRITEQEAMAERQKEALISFLGIGNVSLMDINTAPFEMQYGDVVMLCSDGITKTLPDSQIQQIILDDRVKPGQKAEALVEAATHVNSHSQDNTSVALIHYHEEDIKQIRG